MRFFVTIDNKVHRIVFKHRDNETSAIMSIQINGVWLPIEETGASCSPLDQYNKWFGQKLALTRLANLSKNAETRKALWQAYFESVAEQVLNNNHITTDTDAHILSSYDKLATIWKTAINPKCRPLSKDNRKK